MAEKPLFVVPLALENMSCSSANTGFPLSNLADFHNIGLIWKTATSPASIWCRGEFVGDEAQSVDFCSVIAANASADTQIRLRLGTTQAEVDGTAPYDSGALDFISPARTNEDGLYHSHLQLGAAEEARWFRIDITGHTGAFEAAKLVFGEAVQPSHFYDWGYEFGAEDLGNLEFTPWGVADEEPGLMFRKMAMTLAWQTQTEFETSFRPIMERKASDGRRRVIYCCMDPESSVYRQAKTYMGWLEKPPYARGTRRPGYTQDFSIISFI